MEGILNGVSAPLHTVPPQNRPRFVRTDPSLMKTIGEYLTEGVIKELDPPTAARTKSWVPVFPREKKDSQKVRLITDMRALNQCHHVPRHRGESWKQVLEILQDQKLRWGLTLDLRSWFHHLEVKPTLRRWMRFQVGEKAYQILGMPFGWALSPWWSTKLAKPVRAWLHQQQIPHAWYVDDILILGATKEETEARAATLVDLLTNLGVQVNAKKSMSTAAQTFRYLGQEIDLAQNFVRQLPDKAKGTTQLIRHILSSRKVPPKSLAKVAGSLLDLGKGNAKLHGLPQQVMKHAALGVNRNRHVYPGAHVAKVWGSATHITHSCRNCLTVCKLALQEPTHKVLRAKNDKTFSVQSDACESAWGARLMEKGQEIYACARKWTEREALEHITHLEAKASALAVQEFLDKIPRGSSLLVQSDAISTVWCWRKGSKIQGMNTWIAQAAEEAAKRGIYIVSDHIPGIKNTRADYLSRNPDPKNYRLSPEIFRSVCQHFRCWPDVDLFANRGNRQVQRFCSWRLDKASLGNAWEVNWGKFLGWMNPPWEMVARCMKKVKEDNARVMVCLPLWRAAPWWKLFMDMVVSDLWIWRSTPLFQNPQGVWLPPRGGRQFLRSCKVEAK